MTREALAITGQVIGYYFGGPIGAAIGGAIGGTIGGYLDPPDPIRGPRLEDRKVSTSSYGSAIPLLYGAQRIAGNVIWAADLEEVETETEAGGKGGPSQTVITYSYYATFAVLCCFGPTRGIRRIWADAVLIYDGSNAGAPPPDFGLAIYTGDETQLPDATMEAALGVGNVPAYRGYTYFVAERMPLERFGNRIPSITVELLGDGEWRNDPSDLGAANAFAWQAAVQRLDGHLVVAGETTDSPPVTTLAVINPTTGAQSLVVTHPTIDLDDALDANTTGMCYVPPVNQVWIYCDDNGTGSRGIVRFDADTLANLGAITLPDNWSDWLSGVMYYEPSRRVVLVHRASTAINPNTYAAISLDGVMGTLNPGMLFCRQLVTGGSNIALGCNGLNQFAALSLDITESNVVATQSASGGALGCWDPTRQRYVVSNGTTLWTVTDSLTPTITPYTLTSASVGIVQTVAYVSALDAIIIWGVVAGVISLAVLDADTFAVLHEVHDLGDNDGVIAAFMSPTDPGTALVVGDVQTYEVWLFGTTVGACVADLCERAGLTSADYDVSELTQRLRGYIVSNQAPARSAIEQLAQVYQFDGVEQDDLIYFRRRGGPAVATITLDELGTGIDNAEAIAKDQTRTNELAMPKRCYVAAPDPAMDYQTGTQYAERLSRHAGEEVSIQTAAVLTADEAKRTALALLYDAWAARWTLPVSLMRRYARLVPTDPIEVDGRRYRVTSRLDDSGTYKLELVSDDRDVINQTAQGVDASWQAQTVAVQVPTTLLILDSALLRDAEDSAGAYAAAYGVAPYWRGAVLYTSNDEGDTWSRVATIPRPGAAVGVTVAALGDWDGGNRFDESNSLRVSLTSGTPASTTRLGVLNGGNAIAVEAIIGGTTYWEIVQYRDATLEDDGTYTLTGLLRGRRGTEYAMAHHAARDRVALLDTGTIRSIDIDTAVIGIERPYRAVTIGDTIAQTPETDATLRAERLYPLAPVLLGGGRNASLDVILAWVRRTRVGGEWRDSVDASLGEDSEAYIVRIYTDANRTTVVRTISGLSTQTTTYTAAQQVTDFGATQARVYWDVRQVSATVGAGHAGEGIT